jgi:hypothetical protein
MPGSRPKSTVRIDALAGEQRFAPRFEEYNRRGCACWQEFPDDGSGRDRRVEGGTGACGLHQRRGPAGTGLSSDRFWAGFDRIVHDLAPVNRDLLAKRDQMQAELDRWHRENRGRQSGFDAYKAFLRTIGYLLPEGPDFSIGTSDVDPEISSIAGPQLSCRS